MEQQNLSCSVPNCDQPTLCGWGFRGVYIRICLYHRRRHDSPKDKFSLFDVIGMSKYKGVKLDQFGCPIPRDADEFEIKARDYAAERKTKSLARLKAWKEGHRPPPPPKLNERRHWERKRDESYDNIVGGILNGD